MRHRFGYGTTLGALIAAWGLGVDVSAAEVKRPNILFIFADDWGRHASAYARIDGSGGVNDILSTPNFDRVVKEGVLFRLAFVSAPSCTPCRSALISGQHFGRTGRSSILQGAIWDGSNVSFPLLLRDSGCIRGDRTAGMFELATLFPIFHFGMWQRPTRRMRP
jgi:hypothetical protein